MSSNKVVGRATNNGNIDYTTNFTISAFAVVSVKTAVTLNGSKYWVNNVRIEYIAFGQKPPATHEGIAAPGVFQFSIANCIIY